MGSVYVDILFDLTDLLSSNSVHRLMRKTLLAIVIVSLTVGLLASCSLQPNGDSAKSARQLDVSWEQLKHSDDPLSVLFGQGWNLGHTPQDELVGEAAAQCMREEGFGDLVSVLGMDAVETIDPVFEIQRLRDSMTPIEFARNYGLGSAETERLRIEPKLSSQEQTSNEEAKALEVLNSMTPSEREALFQTYLGSGVPLDNEGFPTENHLSSVGGCLGQAEKQVRSGTASYEEHQDIVRDIYTRVSVHPEMVEMENLWQQCMSGRGYNYDHVRAMNGFFAEKAASLANQLLEGKPQNWSAQIDAAVDEEVPVAVASAECSPGFRKRSEDLVRRIAIEVLGANLDELGISN